MFLTLTNNNTIVFEYVEVVFSILNAFKQIMLTFTI